MKRPKFEVFRRVDGMYDWRLRARNGRIIGTSGGQGYRSAFEAKRAVHTVLAACGAPVVFIEVVR